MTNYAAGHEAEKYAAQYLENQEFEIITLNWSNRLAEIDIVAKKDEVIYFIEVKYRRTNSQGSGLDYVTPQKLKQMEFAARCWVEEQNYDGDYELSALELSADFQVTNFIDMIM